MYLIALAETGRLATTCGREDARQGVAVANEGGQARQVLEPVHEGLQ